MAIERPTAFITGAGRGIGRAIALKLAGAGYALAVTSRTQSEIDETVRIAREKGAEAIAIAADVADEKQINAAVADTIKQFGCIDVLVNNAGIGILVPLKDMTTGDFDRMFATNVRGVFLTTKAVLPGMLERGSCDIINIASLAGRNSFKGGTGYSATKWALIGFARSLLLEVRHRDIRVMTICPGSVDTSFNPRENAKKETRRVPKAEDIARVVLDALRMPRHVMLSEIDVRPTNPNW